MPQLSALIFLLFVALTFVLMRNLLKLFAERAVGILGRNFEPAWSAGVLLLLSPVMVMYGFAYGLMNRSIDKWFSTPVEEVGPTLMPWHLLAAMPSECESRGFGVGRLPEVERGFGGHGFSGCSRRISAARNHAARWFRRGRFGRETPEASFNAPCALAGD